MQAERRTRKRLLVGLGSLVVMDMFTGGGAWTRPREVQAVQGLRLVRQAVRTTGGGSSGALPEVKRAHARGAADTAKEDSHGRELVESDFFTVSDKFVGLEQAPEVEVEEDVEGPSLQHEGLELQAKDAKGYTDQRSLYTSLRYGVIAILGSQASGKSTLLNKLFGTSFPVLDASATGIKRTTQGVWVDLDNVAANATLPLVVVDMEGLQSTARGEASTVFDEQLAALAVGTANVIILNVWARDVRAGVAVGQKQLFASLASAEGGRRRRAVAVVLRDSEEPEADIRIVQSMLDAQLTEAYEKAGRGRDAVKEVQLSIVAMPHIVYRSEGFEEGLQGLRRAFVASTPPAEDARPLQVLQDLSRGQMLQPVPLRQFPSFAMDLWSSMTGGQVPSVEPALKEMSKRKKGAVQHDEVRTFVRQKVVESCCQEAERAVERLQGKVEAAVEMPILEFGRDAEAIFATALKSLDDRLKSYEGLKVKGAGASRAKGDEEKQQVVDALSRRLQPIFAQHVDALQDYYMGRFQDGFAALFCPPSRFDKESRVLCQDVCGTFEKAAKSAVPAVARKQWSYQGPLAKLKDEIDVEIVDRRMEIEVAFPEEPSRVPFMRAKWWRSFLVKALVVYINYLQTVQASQATMRAAKRRQERFPPFPLF